MSKRTYWNTESFSKKVNELTDGEYVLLGEYTKSHDKTTFKHNKCGTVFEMAPHDFLNGQRCPKCAMKKRKNNKRRKTYEQFDKEINELTNGEYTVEPPYVNSKTKMTFTHKKCGTTFEMKPNNFLNGHRCPVCTLKGRIKKRTKTQEQFVKEVDDCYGKGQYTVLGTYVNADTPILVIHNGCGNEYEARPADLIRGHGCQKCAYKVRATKIGVNQRSSLKDVKKEIKGILGSNYVVLTKDEDYKGNRQKIAIKHLKCGHTYRARFSDIQHGRTGCPYCHKLGNFSNGEHAINMILQKYFGLTMDKDYIYGYVSPLMTYKSNLHYDFWFPKRKLAIEYDGKQHFMPVNYFGGVESFKEQQKRDQTKDKFCKDHNITLVRIPYTVTTNKDLIAVLSNYFERS